MVRKSHAVKDVMMVNHEGFQPSTPWKFARISALDEFTFVYVLDE
jgi:hypothetical protein